jgi:hypothetical protein
MIMAQSGPNLDVVLQGLHPLALMGAIQRDRLDLQSENPPSGTFAPAAIEMQALLGHEEPTRLSGVIDGACGPAAFQASRLPAGAGDR